MKTKQIDGVLADDLALDLSHLSLKIKHVIALGNYVDGFYFTYLKDGLIHYDQVPVIKEALGNRIKIAKFCITPRVKQMLHKREYLSWYVYTDETLYPVQKVKYEDLMDSFYFVIDDTIKRSTVIPIMEQT